MGIRLFAFRDEEPSANPRYISSYVAMRPVRQGSSYPAIACSCSSFASGVGTW